MAVDDIRTRARRELEELGLSVDSASYLVEDRPPGGWDSLVTKEFLQSELHREMRDQTWRFVTVVIAAQGISVAAMAAIGAAFRFA